MNFDTVLLAAVTDELNGVLLGARVDKIAQPDPLELVVALFKDGVRRSLLISADPNAARIHLIRERVKRSPIAPPAFCMLLRKYLEGGQIEELSQPLGFCERVMRIRVAGASRERSFLWVELMGRQSNVVLTNEAGTILGSIKKVTADMSRLREVRTGLPYAPPPRQVGYKRDPMEPLSAIGLPTEPFAGVPAAEAWLTTTFRGVGSFLAKEAVLRADGEPLTGERVWYGLNTILTTVRLAEFSPVVVLDDNGQVTLAYPLALRSVDPTRQTAVESISAAIEAACSHRMEEDTFTKERTALLAALRKALKSSERQLIDVREGLLNSEQSEYIKESGELLLANIGQLSAGVNEATVLDYFAEELDQKRAIALDPSLTIHENAERYFRRYQKARDSKGILRERQEQLNRTVNELEEALRDAEAATTVQQLSALSEHTAGSARASPGSAGRAHAAKPAFDGHKIKSITSPDGWEILVGENSTSNDFLTTKVASPSDIWFHVRAAPSAHAVIRAQNRPASVSTAAILLAAEQVAKRSQAKHAHLVSVDYTLKKYVRKPRGSAPGQVTYTNEKTIDVIASGEN